MPSSKSSTKVRKTTILYRGPDGSVVFYIVGDNPEVMVNSDNHYYIKVKSYFDYYFEGVDRTDRHVMALASHRIRKELVENELPLELGMWIAGFEFQSQAWFCSQPGLYIPPKHN